MKKVLLIFLFILKLVLVSAQSIFLSEENQYYDFLALSGILESPALNYKSLSDLQYTRNFLSEVKDVWYSIQFDKRKDIKKDFCYKIFSPELFMSYNTSSPYGLNDEALWQGKVLIQNLQEEYTLITKG